ncbi:hypothetical protein L873DRAFT_1820084, partial [Choiromyces venosus 120613-1]
IGGVTPYLSGVKSTLPISRYSEQVTTTLIPHKCAWSDHYPTPGKPSSTPTVPVGFGFPV